MATLKTILLTIGQLILILFIGFLTRESWRIYSEGKKAEHVNAAGTRILIHSPTTQEFVQPGKSTHTTHMYKTSPLVRWIVLSQFSGPNTMLAAFIGLAGLFLILATGFLANLTHILLVRKLGDAIIFVCAIAGAIFLTYDAISYWRYYSHLRHQGVPETVLVEDIEKEREYQHNRTDDWWISYIYWARVSFRGESRVIAVGSSDFDHTKAGGSLPVLYDQSKDDLMSVNYSLEYSHFILPLFVWFLVLFIYNRRLKTWLTDTRKPPSTRP